jgi:hypothetical protein
MSCPENLPLPESTVDDLADAPAAFAAGRIELKRTYQRPPFLPLLIGPFRDISPLFERWEIPMSCPENLPLPESTVDDLADALWARIVGGNCDPIERNLRAKLALEHRLLGGNATAFGLDKLGTEETVAYSGLTVDTLRDKAKRRVLGIPPPYNSDANSSGVAASLSCGSSNNAPLTRRLNDGSCDNTNPRAEMRRPRYTEILK